MPHLTFALRLATAAALLGACAGDPDSPVTPLPPPPPPPPASRLELAQVTPAGDTTGQRRVEMLVRFRDGTPIRHLRVYADSGTPDERQFRWAYDGWSSFTYDSLRVVAIAPGPGQHRFTVAASTAVGDTSVASASITRTFVFPEIAYTATALPDLGAGADALWITAAGDVAGWVVNVSGRRRAAVWRGGTLSVLAVGDTTVDVIATRMNAAGDVLLMYASPYGVPVWAPTAVWALRADGRLLPIGTSGAAGSRYCCAVAADLNDQRQALATMAGDFPYGSTLVDLTTGALDTTNTRFLKLNDRGQAAGTITGGYSNMNLALETRGFTASPVPAGARLTICDLPGRFSRTIPIDLDDDANLLADYCGNPVLFRGNGPAEWADRYVGRGQLHLSRQGGVLAALDSTGAIYTWRIGASSATRVIVSSQRWRLDGLSAVNASGAMAASGVDLATGRRAALLLTPSRSAGGS